MKFTELAIRNLKPQASRFEVLDDDIRGFCMRVTPNGAKSWVLNYKINTVRKRMTLGTYPLVSLKEARQAALAARKLLDQGLDPTQERDDARREEERRREQERQQITVAQLLDEYMERWAKPNKRSWREDERIIQHDLLPAMGKMKAKDVRRVDVVRMLDGIVDRGSPIQANRTFGVIRKAFNFGVQRGLLETTPIVGIQAPAANNRRERMLSESEMLAVWRGLADAAMEPITKTAIKLLLLTAQRSGEVAGMEWSEIDGPWWTIPGEKAKNGRPHRVFLSEQAREVLAGLDQETRFVIQSPRTTGPIVQTALSHAIRRNLAHFGVEHFTPHDLRRTTASHMTGMGISRLVVSKILNHVEQSITAVYDRHTYDAEKQTALEAWGRRLTALVEGRDEQNNGKIVRLGGQVRAG